VIYYSDPNDNPETEELLAKERARAVKGQRTLLVVCVIAGIICAVIAVHYGQKLP
jgi:hypothetical protein